ncbi:hypothetical protein [Caldimonas thermodepolymerans]|jgi:hypothetical protein|uniref:hypothetical protein n=1 Tax=Caldimonas thermodepolymerans TaxID=215580 RepID=UPI002491A4EB|nr:hypothetical protein [Caldimonas thermodepolymerans]
MDGRAHTKQPPTVQATWTSDGTSYRITCPHCFRVHVHGPQPGHRAAHCEPGTPGKVLGYFIEPPADQPPADQAPADKERSA